ncbi:MAG: sensor histidine kinase, partial [Prosthecobacter sp.]|nr:sensor histidine kinase [Prosthecobacter sp.]
ARGELHTLRDVMGWPSLYGNVRLMPSSTTKALPPTLIAAQQAIMRTKGFRTNPAKGYTAALATVAVFFGFRLLLGESVIAAPFLQFFPAIIIGTLLGGLGGGLVVVASSAVLAWYFFIPDANAFTMGPTQLLTVGLFVATGSVGAVIVNWLMQIAEHAADFDAHEQALLRELQHRVKNHVQIVSSLLQIQSRRADPTTQAALQEAGRRLATISAVYGSLYRSGHEIDFKAHLEDICHVASRAAPDTQCEFKVQGERVSWDMDLVMPLSLITGELVANAIKHGCAGHPGRVDVTLVRSNGNVTLTVADTGARLPEGFDVEKTKGLGLQLVRTLCRQINGKFSATAGDMTRFIVEFPETPQDPQ